MQNVKKDIKTNVMEKIKKDEIVMRPRYYFIIGSIFSLIGLIACAVTSIFLISLASFMLRQHGPMGEYRLALMLNSFPLWIPVLAIIGIVIGVFMLRKYDFSYKSNFWLILASFLIAIIIAGILIDISGFNNLWMNKGPMNQIMKNHYLNNNSYPNSEFGSRRNKGNGGYKFKNNIE